MSSFSSCCTSCPLPAAPPLTCFPLTAPRPPRSYLVIKRPWPAMMRTVRCAVLCCAMLCHAELCCASLCYAGCWLPRCRLARTAPRCAVLRCAACTGCHAASSCARLCCAVSGCVPCRAPLCCAGRHCAMHPASKLLRTSIHRLLAVQVAGDHARFEQTYFSQVGPRQCCVAFGPYGCIPVPAVLQC